LDFDYPETALEVAIVTKESGVDEIMAEKLVQIAHRARNLKGHGLDEGITNWKSGCALTNSPFLSSGNSRR
jgi:nitric oxide reductase NorQ protein